MLIRVLGRDNAALHDDVVLTTALSRRWQSNLLVSSHVHIKGHQSVGLRLDQILDVDLGTLEGGSAGQGRARHQPLALPTTYQLFAHLWHVFGPGSQRWRSVKYMIPFEPAVMGP